MSKFFKSHWPVILILSLFFTTVLINLPKINVNKSFGLLKINYIGGYQIQNSKDEIVRDLTLHKGLDISGGAQVILAPDLSGIESRDIDQALTSLKAILENRVNRFGVNEPNILVTNFNGNYRINVEIPGVEDVDRALELVGKTAQLSFGLEDGEVEVAEGFTIPDFKEVDLNSNHITKAEVELITGAAGATTNEPSVKLVFNSEGTRIFADITKENKGKRLAIYLDDQILIAPVINDPILTGEASITGAFTVDQAKDLAIQINSGALPVPVSVYSKQQIGPTVGATSVYNSVLGGLVGLFLVAVFMVLNYKKLGVISVISLAFYGLITVTIYKLIPITVTLPGIAGLILSIGMAVDSSILIFESVKDYSSKGVAMADAVERGFDTAWTSIKDANIVGLIIAFVLFNPFDWGFLLTSGPVRGFAATLGVGIFVSLFTGVFVTKYLLKLFYKPK
jgi:preprotein translocase subunit SecD